MNLRKIINARIRRRKSGVDIAGDVNAVVAANVNEPGGSVTASSRQTVVRATGSNAGSGGGADERTRDRDD